ncbi:molybdate ABC transporter substrate-binding protein [Jannaschia sp. LMIT008]|uniref:molybdate ABC transporter substrate-binding protein n=1 Tax=Jannaschia maritima TaxID=3032585 RepID=UPI0028119179|nr:molybdate ABC transporter substrate-binding protein [Jannaschia sp. LMIT008]
MASPFRSDRRAVLAGGAAYCVAGAAGAEDVLTVFAAASLKTVLDGWALPGTRLTYAGSGTLARQIAHGAPADVVILAARDWMDWLIGQGAVGRAHVVAGNVLVFAARAGGAPLPLTSDAVLDRLGDGRLAMGDPLSVPAGRYARQALVSLGLWDAVVDRLIVAENVRAALAYVARGDVPLGVVYRSDLGAGVDAVAEVPPDAHDPIEYLAAVTAGAGAPAHALIDDLTRAGDVFAAHGFTPA